jgi:hypothetical protein
MRFYSTENSEEPGNIGYIIDAQRLNWQHNRQQTGNMLPLFVSWPGLSDVEGRFLPLGAGLSAVKVCL